MPGDQKQCHSGELGCRVAITSNKSATGLPVDMETA